MAAVAWYHTDAASGYDLFELRAMETRDDGSCVYWGVTTPDDELDVVMQGFTEAVATFKPDPWAFGGASVIWTNESSLAERPAELSTETAPTQTEPTSTTIGSEVVPSIGRLGASLFADLSADDWGRGDSAPADLGPGGVPLDDWGRGDSAPSDLGPGGEVVLDGNGLG